MKIPLTKSKFSLFQTMLDFKNIFKSNTFTSGKYVDLFQEELKDYLNTNFALVTSSATTALQCAVACIPNLKLGDEILVADFSFPASANAISWLGYKPILVDSERYCFGMEIESAEKLVTEKTKAVVAVDPFGLSPNFEKILDFCKRHSLFLIEDAACALGSQLNNQFLGTFGKIGCLSFHPRKLVNSGEGGALISNDYKIDAQLQKLRSHGFEMSDLFPEFTLIGTNARLSEFSSALGFRQLLSINSEIEGRSKVFKYYLEELGGSSHLTFPIVPSNTKWNYQTMVLQMKSLAKRNEIVQALRREGVSSTLGTYATHSQKAYRRFGYKPGDLPNSYNFQKTLISIPMYSHLSKVKVRKISKIIRASL